MERLIIIPLLFLFATAVFAAERYRPTDREQLLENWFMRQMEMETDDLKKVAKIEALLTDSAGHEGFHPWLLLTLQEIHFKRGDCAAAIAAGDRLLNLKPGDLQVLHENVQCAEKVKDPKIKERSARMAAAARKVTQDAAADEESKAYAKALIDQADYQAFVEIASAADPRRKLALMDVFTKERPHSTYTPQVSQMYFHAYSLAGDTRATLALAERIAAADPDNEEALIVIAEGLFARDQEPERVLSMAQRVVAIVEAKPRPESYPEAEWARRKGSLLTRAAWIAGRIHMDGGRFGQADRMLRAALPGLKGNDAFTAQALFHLGWANYKTGNVADALRFNQMCMAYRSSFYEQARKNLDAIKAEQGLK